MAELGPSVLALAVTATY